MKPHETNLRYVAGLRSIHHGALPVALHVDAEWGPLLAAAPELARTLDLINRALDAGEAINPGTGVHEQVKAALRKAGVLP